jgi:glutathione S-transferase
MKHYYNAMSRAVTTHWMLTELGVEHEQIVVDFMKGETGTPEYRAINPMGKIPTLVDGDIIVTEVAAICAYLADKFPEKGLAPATDSSDRGSYYRYLFVPGTTLEPDGLLVLNLLLQMLYLAACWISPCSLVGWHLPLPK